MEERERKKYEKVWARNEYRNATSLGLLLLKRIPVLKWLDEYEIKSVLDAGCGRGSFIQRLQQLKPDISVFGMDIAGNAPDHVIADCFIRGALWDSSKYHSQDAIFCVDVMEHIPPEYVDRVLANFKNFADKFVFLSICLVPDNFGEFLIGEPLHLTVKDIWWWLDKIKNHNFDIKFCLGLENSLDVLLV